MKVDPAEIATALAKYWDLRWQQPWGEVVLMRGAPGSAGPSVFASCRGRVVASWSWPSAVEAAVVAAAIEEAARCGQRAAEYVAPEADDARVAEDVGGEE